MANRNELRDYIKKYRLLDYIDQVPLTQRSKDIIIRYVNGESQAGLSRIYGVSFNAIHQVIAAYRSNVVKYLYQSGQLTSYEKEKMEQELQHDLERRLQSVTGQRGE